ncbi:MAG: VWA domain-containing protein [bacterium]|nr:VWA domain-containing protein [bacterium]
MRTKITLTSLLFALTIVGWTGPTLGAGDENLVRVVVESPRPGEVVKSRTDMAPLNGIATAGERPSNFDVMLVIDVSGSTKYPSGIDIDGDGEIGETKRALVRALPDTENTDPEDSILAAEVTAGMSLLEGLNPERVRVGIVSFSGEIDPITHRRRSVDQKDALLEQPLTDDYARLNQALEAVLLRGPHGGTNMEAGVKLALRELAGLSGAQSQPRPRAKRVILFLTDGKPSLPFGLANLEDPEDTEAVIAAARLAKAAGVTMNVYGMGPPAIDYPIAATEMARVTGGLYTPVRRPGDIVSLLTGVSFANVEAVVAVNLTLRESSGPDDIWLAPDGSFRGFVPVRLGKNRIRVSALASDGTRGSTELDIVFKHQGLTDAERRAELERIRERNREIQLRLERERQDTFRKQERERALEIEVEDDDEESQP